MSQHAMTAQGDLALLLQVLPPQLRHALAASPLPAETRIEVVLDLGRVPEARYDEQASDLGQHEVTHDDLAYVTSRIGAFGTDNRAGIQRTLHRISAIRNRGGAVIGLTCRV